MAEASGKERARKHEAGREAEIAGDKNAAGLGIELAAEEARTRNSNRRAAFAVA